MPAHSHLYEFDGVAAEKCTYDAGLYMAPHKDLYPKFSLLLQGSFLETTPNGTVEIDKPCLIIKPDTVLHENRFGPGGAAILTITFFHGYPSSVFLQDVDYLKYPQISILGLKLWTKLKKVSRDKELHGLIAGLEQEINALRFQQKKYNHKLEQGEKLLRELEVTLKKVNDVASALFLHRVYFSRAFKKYYNISPAGFAQCSRLLKAVLLIIHSNASLTAIAYEMGFADQSHFTRTIRKRLGCTPLELRALLKG